MSTQPTAPPPASTGKKSPIPLPAAIGLLVIAVLALFFFVVKPMLFPAADDTATPPPAGAPAMPGTPGAPGMPGTPAPPAPGAVAPGAPGPGAKHAQPGMAPKGPGLAPSGPMAPKPPRHAGTPAGKPGGPMSHAPAAMMAPGAGEIAVSGTVQKVLPGAKAVVVRTTRIRLPGKGEITLNPARTKVVYLSSPNPSLKPGAPVTALGPNLGKGKPLHAKQIGR